jgi:hypothetical protein
MAAFAVRAELGLHGQESSWRGRAQKKLSPSDAAVVFGKTRRFLTTGRQRSVVAFVRTVALMLATGGSASGADRF